MTWDEKKINPPGQWTIDTGIDTGDLLIFSIYSRSSSSSRSDCLYMASVLLCYLHR